MAEPGALALALLVTAAATGPIVRLLRHRQVVDVPNARSSHQQVTPRGGGIAVILGLLAGCVAGSGPLELWLLIGVAVAAAAIGLLDDLRDLSASLRLTSQVLLALAVSMVVLSAGQFLPVPAWMFVVAVLGWVAGYVNAFNFMDGINGISSVSGALAGAWFLLLGAVEGDPVLGVGGAVLVGACLGFLPWNFPRAQVFLGDVGSYGLGALIGSLPVWAVATGVDSRLAAAPLLVYIADTGWTLVRRGLRGETLSRAHREHAYQRLCDAGFTHGGSTGVVAAATVAVCLLLWWLPVWAGTPAAGLVLAGYLALPSLLVRRAVRRQRVVP